jgi:hypothetical protein
MSQMSTIIPNSSIPPEDIDLLVLAERTILFFRKYKWIFFLAIILGLGFGFLTWSRLPKVYKSRLILHSYTLSNPDYIEIIDNWNSLLLKNDHDQLAASLGVPAKVLHQVKEIKASEIQKVFTPTNTNGFYIDVFVTDNAVLDDLQNGILNGLENVDYIKRQLTIKKENLTTLISEVQMEIVKLDSTKAKVEQMLGGNNTRSSSLIIDISGLNKQLIEMNEKLLYYKQDLKLTNAVQVLQGFSKFSKPAGPNLFVWLGLGLISFLAMAYVYAIFRSISGKLKVRSKQKQHSSL